MNDIQNSFLEAIQLMTDSGIAHSSATTTVKVEITEVVSINQGTYKAKYLGDSLTVYAMNQDTQYSVGDIVYILIPDGNFSNKKLILGSAKIAEEYNAKLSSLSDSFLKKIYDISENLILGKKEFGLCSYQETEFEECYAIGNEDGKTLIAEYLKSYNTFYFGVTIQTALDPTQKANNGKYGVRLSIPLISLEDPAFKYRKEVQIDPSNILGRPYALEVPMPQALSFSIDNTQFTIDPDKNEKIIISRFCESGRKEGGFISNSEKTDADIFLTDFVFKTIEELPESTQHGYSLTIGASEGTLFTDNTKDEKILTPTVRFNGEEVTSLHNAIYYWLIEDNSIFASSKGYISHAGAGWRCINEVDEEGNPISAPTMTVKRNDLVKELKYKCVIVYDGSVISNTITLENIDEPAIELNLTTSTGSTKYSKNDKYVILTMSVKNNENKILGDLSFFWLRKDKNGILDESSDFEDVKSDELTSTVRLSIFLINELNTVSCTVKKADGTILGTKSLTITIEEEEAPLYRLVINNSDKIYKYDSDGDSPMIANYDGPVSSIISAIDPITYKVFKRDGEELSDLEYGKCQYKWIIPKNSLIEVNKKILDSASDDKNYYYIEGIGNKVEINYDIASKFNNSKTDNTIILQVMYDNNLIENKTNLFFLKDGASGTNGTKYSAIITYEGAAYGQKDEDGRAQKLRIFYDKQNKEWYYNTKDEDIVAFHQEGHLPSFDVSVYADGQPLEKGNGYTVTYSWFDAKNKNPEKTLNPCLIINGNSISHIITDSNGVSNVVTPYLPVQGKEAEDGYNLHILEAAVKITESGTESSVGTETVVYAHYPIEMTYTTGEPTTLVSLDGGFGEVLYATDGTNPQYDTSTPFEYTGATIENNDNWYAFGHVSKRFFNAETKTLKCAPDSKYDDGNTRNYVAAAAGNFVTIRPIVFIYNRYEMSNLNGWDGNKLTLDENGAYILAPQVGAGVKHSDNTFTGVVMGIKKFQNKDNKEESEIGLFGYGHGKQTIFLDSKTGGFSFGGDRIVFTPASPEVEDSQDIMTFKDVILDWKTSNVPDLDEMPELQKALGTTQIGNNYIISPNIGGGYLHIVGGEDSKTKKGVVIDPSGIDPANTGYIFNIYNGQSNLYAVDNNSQIYADEDEDYGKLPLKTFNTVMGITNEGDAYFNGTVEAEAGHIGQFKINNKYIEHESRIMGMGTDANWAFWAGYNSDNANDDTTTGMGAKFRVSQDGFLYSEKGKIGGIDISSAGISSGNFGLWKKGAHEFKGKGVVMHAGDVIAKAPFIIYQDGSFESTKGTIGGWTIEKGQLKAKAGGKWTAVQAPADGINWVFAAGGTSETSYGDYPFRVDKEGNFVAKKATITGNITCTSLDVSGAATIAGLDINKVGGGSNGANMTFNGQVTCANIVANGGTIANWDIKHVIIDENTLYGDIAAKYTGYALVSPLYYTKTTTKNYKMFQQVYLTSVGILVNLKYYNTNNALQQDSWYTSSWIHLIAEGSGYDNL